MPGDATTAPWPKRRSASPSLEPVPRFGDAFCDVALVPYWAVSIEFARGQAADAMDRLEKGLNLVADLPGGGPILMCFRGLGGGRARPGRSLPYQRSRGPPCGRTARQRPVPCPRPLETSHPRLLPPKMRRLRCTTFARSSCTGVPGRPASGDFWLMLPTCWTGSGTRLSLGSTWPG